MVTTAYKQGDEMDHERTIELVSLALDAALMRQTAITSNVAHVNTQGYQAMSVNFEEQLNLLSSSDDSNINIKPIYVQDDSPVKLDEQVALSVQNATQYRALIKGLNHQLAIMELAVHGNNAS